MKNILIILFCISIVECKSQQKLASSGNEIKLITLDPGHFHAALVQKVMYKEVDSLVQVYAPDGADLNQHLGRIKAYNTRLDNPTTWKEEVYTGNDFLEKMLSEKKGNVVVMSGNNQKKTEYIFKAVKAGFNVLADKPMAIDKKNFELLKNKFFHFQQPCRFWRKYKKSLSFLFYGALHKTTPWLFRPVWLPY